MNKIVKKIKVLLGMVKSEFETALLTDGSEISFDALEINREVYDAEGNSLPEGEYTLEDGTKIGVDENGIIKTITRPNGETEKEEVVVEAEEAEGSKASDGKGGEPTTEGGTAEGEGTPTAEDADKTEKVDEATTPESVTVINEYGKKVKVPLKNGTTTKLSDGEYTDINEEYIVEIKGGAVSGWRSAKAPENKPTESDDTLVKRDELEARIDSLENAVNDIYEMVLKIAENQKEAEVKVDETIQEFSKMKSDPQTAPLHFGNETKQDEELSAVDKFLKFKHNK